MSKRVANKNEGGGARSGKTRRKYWYNVAQRRMKRANEIMARVMQSATAAPTPKPKKKTMFERMKNFAARKV